MMVRLGAAAIGVLTGVVIGLMLAVLFVFAGALPAVPFAAWVFGTPFVLAGICFSKPSIAFALFPGLAHFFVGAAEGLAAGENFEDLKPERSAPEYAKVVFYCGIAAGALILVAVRWNH